MPGEFNNESTNGSARFFPSTMPEGLDLVIADPGCAPYQMLGYRLAGDVCHQAWPPTKLPAGLLDTDPSKREEALAALGTAQNESMDTHLVAELGEIKTLLVSRVAQSKNAKKTKSTPVDSDAATDPSPNVVIEDCEELMLLMAKRNAEVPKLSARKIEQLMVQMFAEEIGETNCFTYRTIQETVLYKLWRKSLKKARHDVEWDDLSDALDTGLEIASRKHGRSDRRKDYSPKQEAAIRDWKKGVQNAAAQAAHRAEDRNRGR